MGAVKSVEADPEIFQEVPTMVHRQEMGFGEEKLKQTVKLLYRF